MSKDQQKLEGNNVENNNQSTIQINLETISINTLVNNFNFFDKYIAPYNEYMAKVDDIILGKMNIPFYSGFTVMITDPQPINAELDNVKLTMQSNSENLIIQNNQDIRSSVGDVDTLIETEGNIIII